MLLTLTSLTPDWRMLDGDAEPGGGDWRVRTVSVRLAAGGATARSVGPSLARAGATPEVAAGFNRVRPTTAELEAASKMRARL